MARGGFSSVYQATHKVDQQKYAVKKVVLRVHAGNVSHVRENLERMLKEVRLFAAINDLHIVRYNHSWLEVSELGPPPVEPLSTAPSPLISHLDPEIDLESPYIDFENSSDSPSENSEPSPKIELAQEKPDEVKIILYIQMELCKQTLEGCLDELNTLYPSLANSTGYEKRLFIAYQILEGTYTLHKAYNLIHRDISLKNIFIGKDGVVKIGDFGLATKCQHIVPLRSSPIAMKPVGQDLELDSFCLDGLSDDKSDEHSGLTHGLGTKAFAAPEQMSGDFYDQKADIYSLGLILLTLFCPTATISERFENIRNARKGRLPEEFLKACPELTGLIIRMVSTDPAERPSIEEVKGHKVFAGFTKKTTEGARRYSMCETSTDLVEVMSMVGVKGKWKSRYVKLCGGKLLVFNKRGDSKARYCYPLAEGNITKDSEARSLLIKIEHREIETLFIKIENSEQTKLASMIELAAKSIFCAN